MTHSLYSSVILIVFVIVEKGVPDFWLMAMKTNEVLSEEVGNLFIAFFCVFFFEKKMQKFDQLYTGTDLRA